MAKDATPGLLARDARFGPLAELTRRLGVPRGDEANPQTQGRFDTMDLLVNLVDCAQPKLLPLLAEQFHVSGDEGWLLAPSETQQRELIKRAIELHRYKGTRWAVNEVFRVLGIEIELKEWWEQKGSGQPYTFDLTAWANDNLMSDRALLNPDLYARLRRMIEHVKPARSSYGFKIGAVFNQPLRWAGAMQGWALNRSGAECRPNPAKPLSQPLRFAGALTSLAVARFPMEMNRDEQ
ncbi:phage tail protein I [Chromobacterium violaceum]|uniref:phage tail protein I n=1 Tax=Chromobacterium violaceum TaxID=536 RepID=UPI00069C0099|nr:phage tail protein I [Chromobacterium violaceum]